MAVRDILISPPRWKFMQDRDQGERAAGSAHMARDNKVRINIRIDADLVERFKADAEQTLKSEQPAGYQTLINEALRECLDTRGVSGSDRS